MFHSAKKLNIEIALPDFYKTFFYSVFPFATTLSVMLLNERFVFLRNLLYFDLFFQNSFMYFVFLFNPLTQYNVHLVLFYNIIYTNKRKINKSKLDFYNYLQKKIPGL